MSAEDAVRQLISELGWADEELGSTPERVAGFLRAYSPRELPEISVFEHRGTDLVVLSELPYYSLCVHHLVPFFGHATIAYVPSGRVVGLSCVAKTLSALAERPQLQERLAAQLADRLQETLAPSGLALRLSARQMCMEMRGARSTGTVDVVASRGDVTDALLRATER